MIQTFKIAGNELLQDEKVADHFISIENFSLKDELDLPRVTVREAALAGMLREHMAVLNIKGLTF
jgi:hypothetical protein